MISETKGSAGNYHFVLYIDSTKPKCFSVAENLRSICSERLNHTYTLDIIDLHVNPDLFERYRIIAVPALDIKTPEGKSHRFIGDMSQSEVFIMAISFMQEARRMGERARDMLNRIKQQG